MTYLLDSNAWIAFFRNKTQPLIARLNATPADEIALCSVVLGELHFGALRSGPKHQAANEALIAELRVNHISLPFDDLAAFEWAVIRNDLEGKGMRIGSSDSQIAAIARLNGLILVTHNTSEFSRVPGLQIEDWQV